MPTRTVPMHPAQFDIYVDQLLNPESPYYNIGLYIKLKGRLDKEKFIETINSSANVFDAYKMRFELNGNEPHCFFDDAYNQLEVNEINFSQLDDPKMEAKVWMQGRFNTPFTIQKDEKLFEHTLIKIAHDEYWFFFKYHHLITDAYGFTIWVNYISQKYKSLLTGNAIQPVYPNYSNEAIRASAYRDSLDYELDGKYWKDKINNRPENLLKNNGYSSQSTKKSGNFYLEISPEQRLILDHVLLVTKSNLHQLTIAALLIYFGNISEQSEMIFGIPVHKRGSGELRNILGMFSGVLPMKGKYENDTKLKDLLKDISIARKEDYPHQNYLIIDLIKSLKIKANESFLYDIIINYVPFKFDLDFGGELETEIFWLQSEHEKMPLQVCWRDYGEQQPLELGFHYGTDYFSHEEIKLLANRIIFILAQFPGALDSDIGAINILPPEEEKMMEAFCKEDVPYPSDKQITDLFEEQVQQTPDNIALSFDKQSLSYAELDARANQLAHHLRSKGVKEAVLVPICMERSIEMIVGILGVLKAGGGYVPIDPEYPNDRINFMLTDTGASIVVCSKLGRQTLKPEKELTIVEIDGDWPTIALLPKGKVTRPSRSQHLAYVIYTSGSTGQPKGVMIEHRSVVNLICSQTKEFNIQSDESILQFSNYAFDASVEQIFLALCNGARLVLIKNDQLLETESLADLISSEKITHLHTTPSFLQNIHANNYGSLKRVIAGGESCPAALAKAWMPYTQFYNEYGPTETTVTSIENKFNKDTFQGEAVSIGNPIQNTQVYMLNQNNKHTPIGIDGEICISGDGLARGYLNNPELSKEKFIPNPFNDQPEKRLYKTGDKGHWLPNGTIIFTGRSDNQVKIRGYRIELGEIETVLQQCELIRNAVVVAKDDTKGGKRLVAYIVPQKGRMDRDALIHYLSNRLPSYMLPAIWAELQELPLTNTGKIDYKALPLMEAGEAIGKHFEAPKNETEKKLLAIWQELLELKKIGIHDNFFELGGDSLIAIQIVSRIKRLGYSMQVKDVFLHQTIEKLASALTTQITPIVTEELRSAKNSKRKTQVMQTTGYSKSLIPAKIGGNKMPLYIVCGGGGTILKFKKFIELLDADQPVYVLEHPTDKKNLAEFPSDIVGIAARYVDEIVTQDSAGPYALSGHCIGGFVVFEMARQLEEMGKTVKLVAMFDTVIRDSEKSHNTLNFFFQKVYAKVHFEAFLLTKHTRHAFLYKIKKMRSFFSKRFFNDRNIEFELFAEQADTFESAYQKYKITPYNKDIVIFYARDQHHFMDNKNNISYKKYHLSESVKNRWNAYAKSATFYEIEGEHSTMFDPKYGGKELAIKLQKHLSGL